MRPDPSKPEPETDSNAKEGSVCTELVLELVLWRRILSSRAVIVSKRVIMSGWRLVAVRGENGCSSSTSFSSSASSDLDSLMGLNQDLVDSVSKYPTATERRIAKTKIARTWNEDHAESCLVERMEAWWSEDWGVGKYACMILVNTW